MHSRLKLSVCLLGIAALFVAVGVRTLLSSDQGQKALKSAKLDYQKVDKAVGQLSDEDLAKLAERSRQAQADFAAGRISDRDLLWIIVIALAIIVLAVALR